MIVGLNQQNWIKDKKKLDPNQIWVLKIIVQADPIWSWVWIGSS